MIEVKDGHHIFPGDVIMAEKKGSVNIITLDSGKKMQVNDEVFEAVTEYEDTPELQNKTVTPSTSQQTVIADDGYQGLDTVTVEAVDPSQYQKPEENCSVTPSTSAQTINPDTGKVFNQVNVSAVTSAIDANIVAGNIKKDVNILGVTGSYEGSSPQVQGMIIEDKLLTVSKAQYLGSGGSTQMNLSKYTLNTPIAIKLKSIKALPYVNSNVTAPFDIPDGTYDLYYQISNIVVGNLKIETINSVRYLTIYATFYGDLVISYNNYKCLLLISIDYNDINVVVSRCPSVSLGKYTSTTVSGSVGNMATYIKSVSFNIPSITSSTVYIDDRVSNSVYLNVCDLTHLYITQ